MNHRRLLTAIISVFIFLCIGERIANAQTTVSLLPEPRVSYSYAPSGCLFFYQAGTSTPAPVYSDASGVYQLSNPVILDQYGSASIWLANQAYDVALFSQGGTNCGTGQQLWKVFNVTAWQILNNLISLQFTPQTIVPSNPTAGQVYYNSTNGCLELFTFSWNCITTAAVTPSPTLQVYIIDPTQSPYNAKCDGATDDSAALQSAINAAIAAKQPLQLPPAKTCLFATGLTVTGSLQMNSFYKVGGGSAVPPNLKYTGSGIALNINNGTSLIYNTNLSNFYLLNANTSTGGIACTYCNTVFINGVQVGGQNIGTIGTGYDFSNSAGIDTHSIQEFNSTNAFKLINSTNVNIDACSVANNSVVFLLGGSSPGNSGIDIHDCLNIEAQNYVLDWDDANPVANTTIGNSIQFHRNLVVFDGGTILWPTQQFVHISNTGTNYLQLLNTGIKDNIIACATGGLCVSSYALNIAISGTTNASTNVQMTVEGNKFSNFSSGAITSNGSTHSNIAFVNNFNDAPADVNGSGNFCVQKVLSAVWNGCPLSIAGSITGTTTITGGSAANAIAIGRYRSTGTTLVSGDWALSGSPSWGTSPSVTINNGSTDSAFSVTVNAGSGSPGASPTATLTFHDGAWLNAPQCWANRADLSPPLPASAPWIRTAISSTTVTFTFTGTPSASTSYGLEGGCTGH